MSDNPGAAALRKWMEETGAKPTAIAVAIGVSRAAVHGYLHGDFRPEGHIRDRIAVFTNQTVRPALWLDESELRALADVKPYEPAKAAAGGR